MTNVDFFNTLLMLLRGWILVSVSYDGLVVSSWVDVFFSERNVFDEVF